MAEHLLPELCASEKWRVDSLDVGTVFQADYMDRNLCMEVPADSTKELHLPSNEVLNLRKAVYGLVNAPKEWFKRLQGDLLAVGFKTSTLDNSQYSPRADGQGVQGVVGVNVDDVARRW